MKKLALFFSLFLLAGAFLIYKYGTQEHYEARLPIDFAPRSKQPRTEVFVGGKSYPFMIDLGSQSFLTMKQEVMEPLEKTMCRAITSTDMKGFEYNSFSYIIPEIKIRNINLKNVEVLMETPDFLQIGGIIFSPSKDPAPESVLEKPGRIGRDLFVKFHSNIFMDFGSRMMYACCHLKDRIKDGYIPSKFTAAPFELNDREGIVLTVGTDFGLHRFMLDTGSTKCVIQPSIAKNQECGEWRPGVPQYHSNRSVIGGKDFGEIDFLLYELAPIFEGLDGVIGMDFMMKHVVYLDFDKKIAYIAKADECRKSQ